MFFKLLLNLNINTFYIENLFINIGLESAKRKKH
jgi:hypothetical protein